MSLSYSSYDVAIASVYVTIPSQYYNSLYNTVNDDNYYTGVRKNDLAFSIRFQIA